MMLRFALPFFYCSAFPVVERDAAAYQSPDLPVSERVADLLSRMSPRELANQLVNKNEGGWADLPGILEEFDEFCV